MASSNKATNESISSHDGSFFGPDLIALAEGQVGLEFRPAMYLREKSV